MNTKKVNHSKPRKISVKDINFQKPIKMLLKAMGEDVNRQGIKDTPRRFEEALKTMLSGYDRNFEDENRFFENHVNYKDIVILKNIDFFSLCEHHLLPFYGYAHIGYIPSEESYLGISKLARAVDIYARRLQTQEVLAHQVGNAIMKHGKVRGVAILIEAKHFCKAARGVEKKVSIMTTCAYFGFFDKDVNLQEQFMELIRRREYI